MTEQEKSELRDRIKAVQERIARAAEHAGRAPKEITLVAASKMNDEEHVRAASDTGISVWGSKR